MRSGPGSESNASNASNNWHPGLLIQTPPPPRCRCLCFLMQLMGSKASQVPALGPTLDSFDAFAAGQPLILMNLLNLKSWPSGADFRFIRFTRRIRMHSMRRPRRGLGGEPGSKVHGGIVDAFDPVDSDPAPNRMHLLHRKWHPGL